MCNHRRIEIVACVLIALAGCGQGAPSAGGPGSVPKDIEDGTKQKVDAAMEAGKAATDKAIEEATGNPAPREGGS